MQPIEILDTLLLYHLMEASSGSASRIDVQLHADGMIETADDGRGMGIEREVGERPYVDLVLGQLDLVEAEGEFDPSWLQLHAIGLSLVVRACAHFELHVAREGRRRQGVWDRDRRGVVWRPEEPCDDHGTVIRARPTAGRLDADVGRRRIERLADRCPGVSWDFVVR